MPLASVKRLLPEKPRFTNEKILGRLKKLAERVPCYGHVNTFVYIDRDGVITPDADVEPWHAHAVARAIATRGKSFLEGITDHLITNYIRGLEGAGRQEANRHPTPDPSRLKAYERPWRFASPGSSIFQRPPAPAGRLPNRIARYRAHRSPKSAIFACSSKIRPNS